MSRVERALIRIKHVGTIIAALALSDWVQYYYSGGPTETYSTMDDIPMLVPVGPEDSDEQVSREMPEYSPGHAVTEECDELPRGKMLPLNSKRLVLPQLRVQIRTYVYIGDQVCIYI